MLKKFRARFSSAHVLAVMALFVALGGSAYAVKKATIGTKQLKDNAVKTAKIAGSAVTTPDLAEGAVTGAKVDEASLGKVPSATKADSADSATTADSATNATNATNAANSGNAAELEGRTLQQVRGLANSDTTTTENDLTVALESVLTANMAIPTGGADVIVNATIEAFNNEGTQQQIQCELRSENVAIGQRYHETFQSGAGNAQVITMTAIMDNVPETLALDPENIALFCGGSGATGDISVREGDMTVQRIPSGA